MHAKQELDATGSYADFAAAVAAAAAAAVACCRCVTTSAAAAALLALLPLLPRSSRYATAGHAKQQLCTAHSAHAPLTRAAAKGCMHTPRTYPSLPSSSESLPLPLRQGATAGSSGMAAAGCLEIVRRNGSRQAHWYARECSIQTQTLLLPVSSPCSSLESMNADLSVWARSRAFPSLTDRPPVA